MPRSLSELKVIPSFCFAFKIPDDVTASSKYQLNLIHLCQFGYLGTIHILRKHIFWGFGPLPPPSMQCKHVFSTEDKHKLPFSNKCLRNIWMVLWIEIHLSTVILYSQQRYGGWVSQVRQCAWKFLFFKIWTNVIAIQSCFLSCML